MNTYEEIQMRLKYISDRLDKSNKHFIANNRRQSQGRWYLTDGQHVLDGYESTTIASGDVARGYPTGSCVVRGSVLDLFNKYDDECSTERQELINKFEDEATDREVSHMNDMAYLEEKHKAEMVALELQVTERVKAEFRTWLGA